MSKNKKIIKFLLVVTSVILFSFSSFLICFTKDANVAQAEGETYVDKIDLTINSKNPNRSTVTSESYSLTSSAFTVNMTASNGVGIYTVSFRNSAYLFSNDLAVTVNKTAHTDFEITYSNRVVNITYTPDSNYIELYNGTNKLSSSIAFGNVDKSQLIASAKTITIKNIGTMGTEALALSIAPQSSGASDSASASASASDSASGSGSSVVAFTLSTSSLNNIAANGEATFDIIPVSDLAVGTYNAVLSIKSSGRNAFNGYSIDTSIPVSITISESYKMTMYCDSSAVASGTEYDLGTVDKDDIGTISKTFSLKNEGEVAIDALEINFQQEPGKEVFALDKTTVASLAVNQSVTFTVTIDANVSAGDYQYTILEYKDGSEAVSGYIVFKIKITEKSPYVLEAYNDTTKLTPASTYNFGSVEYGGSTPSAKTFRIVNAGSNATGTLTVYVELSEIGSVSEAYTCVATIPSIAKGGEYNFTIQPKDNLPIGTYLATVNIYNTENSISTGFGVTYTVYGVTEITSVVVPEGKIIAPVTDATITNQNASGTGYNVTIIYQEKSGDEWITPTSDTFMAGKIYRIKVMATISQKQDYTFTDSTTLTLGAASAENVSINAGKELIIGYKTYEALPASNYSIEMICADDNYADGVYTFDDLEDEYNGCAGALFSLNNLGIQDTGDLTITLTGEEAFECESKIDSIESGKNYILEIKPILGLEPNTPTTYYSATITISNTHFNISFEIRLHINRKTDKMVVDLYHTEYNTSYDETEEIKHSLIGGDTYYYSFDYLLDTLDRPYEKLKVGYTSADAERFTPQDIQIVNRGQNTLSNIVVTHSGAGDQYFDFDFDNLTSSVASNYYQKKYTKFGIAIKTGAPAGTHKTTVVITADNVDPIIITFAFTVNVEISKVVISGLTIPEGYDKASRDLVVETEGVYIRILGWSKVGSSAVWLGKNQNIFRSGDQYRLNLHLNTKTGYVFKNYSNDTSWSGSKLDFNFTIEFEGIDFAVEMAEGNLDSHSLNNPTYAANSCYYTAVFNAKEATLKGSAKINVYDYEQEYTLDANYGVEGLDLASNLRFQWFKDGDTISEPSTISYININKSDITANATYYYQITHTSREGIMRSESIVIGPDTRLKPTDTIVTVTNPANCTQTGTIVWHRDGLEYRVATAYDDTSDTFGDWIDAEVTAQDSGTITTGGGDGGVTTGGGGTGSTTSYMGTLTNIAGGTIIWVRYKATDNLVASEIGVFNVVCGSHTLEHHDAVVPEACDKCEINAVQEYNYCSNCHKYFDMEDNEFDSVDYLTTYATGHEDEDGDLFCDYCGVSMMSRYFYRVESLDDIVAGAKYIIVNSNGQVMSMLKTTSDNGGKYVSATTINRASGDITADRYAASDIDGSDVFVFEIGTLPSKSTTLKTCYTFCLGEKCIDFNSGLILSPKAWDDRDGFSIVESSDDTFVISLWDGSKTLSQGSITSTSADVFALGSSNKITLGSTSLRLYRLVSTTTTLDDKACEINEKKTITDYSEMENDCTAQGSKSSVTGVLDAIDEDYIKIFAKKNELNDETNQIDIKSSVEVLEQTDSEITMDVHPVISCGDKSETIPDRNLNGNQMTLTLFVGTTVPEMVTHRLTSGGEEYYYKEAKSEDQKTFSYETDADGNVYVTFTVTEFSTFVVTLPQEEQKDDPKPTTYTVIFKDYDDTIISSETYEEGATITVPSNPTRAEDSVYTYTFTGWDKTVVEICNANATYTATYSSTKKATENDEPEVEPVVPSGGSGCSGGSVGAGDITGNMMMLLSSLFICFCVVTLKKRYRA